MQRFYASQTDTFAWSNGAVGYGSGSWYDCLGPFAKVRNCPIGGTPLRLTCYAQGYPDTYFSIPAATRHRGRTIHGYFTLEEGGVVFRVLASDRHLLPSQ